MTKMGFKVFILVCAFLAGAVVPAETAVAQPADQRLIFDIYRNGEKFGRHIIDIETREDGKTEARIAINMEYNLGFLTLYRYEHQNLEIWDGSRVEHVETETYDNGTQYKLLASRQNGHWVVETKNGIREESDPAHDIYPTSYWNYDMMKAKRILNTQTGDVRDMEVIPRGLDEYVDGNDLIKAERFTVKSDFKVDVWYDAETKVLIGLSFTYQGADFHYERVEEVSN